MTHIAQHAARLRRALYPWLMPALLLVALGIRLNHLGTANLTFDECASAFISGKSYPAMLAYLRQAFHELPPVYYLVLRAWSLAAGRSEYALRFPSVLFGVLSVALMYRVGRRRIDNLAAWAGALILVVQPFHIHYSQDARPYAMMMLEGLLLFELFQRVRDDGRLRWWLIFGAMAVVSVLTHYVMAFVLVAINLYALSTLNLKRPTLRFALWWFGAQAVIGGLFAIYLFSSKAARNLLREFQGFTLQSVLARLAPSRRMLDDLMWGVQAHPWPTWSSAAIALALLGLILSLLWRQTRPGTRQAFGRCFLALYLLVPLGMVIASPERLSARYAAAIIPAYCLALGVAAAWLWRRHWLLGITIVGMLTAANLHLAALNASIVKSNYGRVVGYLNEHLQPGDAIIFNGPWQWVQQLYYPVTPLASTVAAIGEGTQPVGRLYSPLDPEAPIYWLPSEPVLVEPEPTRQKLHAIAGHFDRAWVLPTAVAETDPQGVVAGWLNEHAYYAGNYQELELYVFDRTAQPEITQDIKADFGSVFRLRQVNLSRAAVHPGEIAPASFSVRVLTPSGGNVILALQLVDRDGNAWTSAALQPGQGFNPPQQWQAGDLLTVRRGIVIPAGMPPGDYALRISAFLDPSHADLWPSVNGEPLPTLYVEVGGLHVTPCAECPPGEILSDGADLTPLNATFGEVLTLQGIHLAGREFWQGHFVAFRLLWRPERPLSQDYQLRIALVDKSGNEVASAKTSPVADWYPTSQWPPGQWALDPQAILVHPRQPAGKYTLRISVLDQEGQPLPVTGARTESVLGVFQRTLTYSGTFLDAGQVTVRARERVFRAGPISHPLDVTLNDPSDGGPLIRLLGYDWGGSPRPGQDARLVLYWQALRETDTPYTVFTHILGPDDTLAGQKDSWPRDGDYPTHFWVEGEIVSDEYLIPFSPQAAPGDYRLMVGMYNVKTNQRLLAVQNGQPAPNNAIVLERFTIGD